MTFTPPALAGRGAPRLATSAVLIAALSFGTTGTVLVNAPAAVDAWSVVAARLLVGAATLLAVPPRGGRSEERRVGKEGTVRCRCGG